MRNGKLFLRLTGLISPPQANTAGTVGIKLKAGFRYLALRWWVTLPAGKTPFDAFTNIRLKTSSGSENRIATLAQHDGILALFGSEGAIIDGANLPVPEENKYCINQPFALNSKRHFTEVEDTCLDVVEDDLWYAELDYADIGATPATIEVVAVVEPLEQVPETTQDGRPFRNINKVERWKVGTLPVGGDDIDLDNLLSLKGQGQLMGLHVYNPSGGGGYVNRLELTVDDVKVFDRRKREVDQELIEAEMFPVAGRLDIVPILYGKGSDAFDTNRWLSFALKPYFSAAASGNCKVILRTWGNVLR